MEEVSGKRVIAPVLTPRPRYEAKIRLDPMVLQTYEIGFPKPPKGTFEPYFGKVWRNECGRKKAYTSNELAERKAESMRARAPGLKINSYHCRWCDWWHIGNRTIRPHEQTSNGCHKNT